MKRYSKYVLKREIKGYAFISLFLIGFLLFFIVPCFVSLKYSFGSIKFDKQYIFEFLGFYNFKRALFIDGTFNRLLLTSLGNVAKDVPIICILSFIIASLVKDAFPGRNLIRAILFLPVVVSSGAVATMDSGDLIQKNMEAVTQQSGLISGEAGMLQFLMNIGLGETPSTYVVYAVSNIFTLVSCSGVQILLCLTALQSISPSLYEASSIEGATAWENFWKITFPMVTPQLIVCAFYTVISRMLSSSNAVVSYIHEINFTNFELGFGSALAWLYLIEVVLVLAVFVGGLSRLSSKYNA